MALGRIPWRLAILAVAPIALFFKALAWLRWGIDMPFLDDWRAYANGDAGSFAIGDLFRPANNTIYATGKILDALAVHLLGFNSIAYQFLSLTICLGSLLLLQLLLLKRIVASSWIAAAAFVSTVLMLQPGGYWGRTDLAYHQAIPLVLLLLCLLIATSERVRTPILVLSIAAPSVVSGWTYISGAFTVAAAAAVSFIFSFAVDEAHAKRLRMTALAFLIAAAITLPMQLWVILFFREGLFQRPIAIWTGPWDWHFWLFILGMISHALSVQGGQHVLRSLAMSAAAFVAFLIPALAATALLSKRQTRDFKEVEFAYVYVTLFCAIGIYLMLVAAGRTNFRFGPASGWSGDFVRGGARFHFFWITILIPWTLAYFLDLVRRSVKWSDAAISIVCAIAVVGLTATLGGFSYSRAFMETMETRASGVHCLQAKLDAGQPLRCRLFRDRDITAAMRFARGSDASFTRLLHFPPSFDQPKVPPMAKDHVLWPAAGIKPPEVVNGSLESAGAKRFVLHGRVDSRLVFRLPDTSASTARGCTELLAVMKISAETGDTAQLFFAPANEPFAFRQSHSVRQAYPGGKTTLVSLKATSPYGFLLPFRIDIGNAAQDYRVDDLTISCGP